MDIRVGCDDPETWICDFCSQKPCVHVFNTPQFVLTKSFFPFKEYVSDDGWAVCAECERLVRAKSWEELKERAIRIHLERAAPYIALGILTKEMVTKEVMDAQRLFREHYRADA